MDFITEGTKVLSEVVMAVGGGLAVWEGVNLLEGYGNDNPGAKLQGMKHVIPSSLEQ